MKINYNISQKTTTSLTLNTSVQQALKLLQMTNIELTEYVNQEALENPFLKVDAPTDMYSGSVPKEISPWNSDHRTKKETNEDFFLENTLVQPENINKIIISQINTSITDPAEHRIALILFGLLDERGFLNIDLKKLAPHLNTDVPLIEKVLSKLKHFEPVGIFASDWKESVLIKLHDQGYDIKNYHLILDNFHDILNGKMLSIQEHTGMTREEIYIALKKLKNMNFYPLKQGSSSDTVEMRIPDVFVIKDPVNGWCVYLNDETLPKVLIDRDYFQTVKYACDVDQDKLFIQTYFQKAKWLIKMMQQRYENILKITHALVHRQLNFFEHGPTFLIPMGLKDLAMDVGVHESTVSRAISNKYIQTPQGTYPLKYFFTQAITGSFQEHSAESIRNQIKHIIQNEVNPLSDDKISEILNNLGIDIARRTVTKYRESMSIPSSTERRRIKKIKCN